jgi:hypothetical protein
MPDLLKPPARARRVAAFHRSGERVVLTPHAIEELFRSAEVLLEGGLGTKGDPGVETWYGSIMITFHLDRVAALCRGLDGPGAIDQLVEGIAGSVRVRLRAHRIARALIYERYPDRSIGTAQIESRFHHEGERLLLDLDLEAPVEAASNARSAR